MKEVREKLRFLLAVLVVRWKGGRALVRSTDDGASTFVKSPPFLSIDDNDDISSRGALRGPEGARPGPPKQRGREGERERESTER